MAPHSADLCTAHQETQGIVDVVEFTGGPENLCLLLRCVNGTNTNALGSGIYTTWNLKLCCISDIRLYYMQAAMETAQFSAVVFSARPRIYKRSNRFPGGKHSAERSALVLRREFTKGNSSSLRKKGVNASLQSRKGTMIVTYVRGYRCASLIKILSFTELFGGAQLLAALQHTALSGHRLLHGFQPPESDTRTLFPISHDVRN